MRRTTKSGLPCPCRCPEPRNYLAHLRARRLVVGLALLAGMASAATAAQAQVQAVRVVRVVDGDTLVVRTAESLNLKVRLQGIDAPECGMPFGQQAQRFLEQLVLGRTVQMATTGRDRYGRTVATLEMGGQDVGLALLRAGIAWHDRRFDKALPAAERLVYILAQQGAKVGREGLWASDVPEAPWLWRTSTQVNRIRERCAIRPSIPVTHVGTISISH
jgi:endonuclease YncB( thermonuclease family)